MLAPFKEADLPPKTRNFWQLVGPGAILVGLSIGSGELIMWPVIIATFGAGMIWAAALGVFSQYWINQELGRYKRLYRLYKNMERFCNSVYYSQLCKLYSSRLGRCIRRRT